MKLKNLTADKLAGIITASALAVGVTLSASAMFTAGLSGETILGSGSNNTIGASTDPSPGASTDPTPGQSIAPAPGETDFDPEDFVPGDFNGDGKFSLKDCMQLRRWLVGWDIGEVNIKAVDVNNNGKIELKDCMTLERRLVGWDV